MLNFAPVTIDSKDIIHAYLNQNVYRNCDFSFSNIYCWKHLYDTEYCIEKDCLFFHFHTASNRAGYMMPLGATDDLKPAIHQLMEDARERNNEFFLFAITADMFKKIEASHPGMFQYQQSRDWAEYLYLSQDLISLKGKKFQSKRNHINKFKKTYRYEYLPITRDIIPDCIKLYDRWRHEDKQLENKESLDKERIAMQTAFDNFERLQLKGGALRIDGEILAYSYGQALNDDTFCVHAEKSLSSIDGGFSMINQQFAEHEGAAYTYINREEDLGLESLRQAKLSYQPAIIMPKGFISIK